MKTCSSCKESKIENQFNKNKTTGDGLNFHCMKCVKARRNQDRHGYNSEELNILADKQDNRCLICHTYFKNTKFVIDHDHNCCPGTFSCGNCIRGLLCRTCNLGLGMFKDNIILLLSAAEYLNNTLYLDKKESVVSLDTQNLIYSIV